MTRINSRAKGQRAERSVVHILQPVVTEVYTRLGCPVEQVPMLQRNQLQSHQGGYDIVGLPWIALEVKHNEKLDLASWWQQAVRQAKNGEEPVLIYKQNAVKFRVMMMGQIAIGAPRGERRRKIRTPVDIAMPVFLLYFRERLYYELGWTQGGPK